MHPRISINTLCLAPAALGDQIATVAGLGARGISPDLVQLDEIGIANGTKLLRNSCLEVATLTHRAFAFATADEAAAGRDRLHRTIDIAGEMGAQSILMTTGGRGALSYTVAVERFVEVVAPCAEHARSAGVRLSIEPTSHLYADVSIAHRLADIVMIANTAGIDATIDMFACWVDADIEAAIAQAAPIAALVQVSDYVYTDRSLPCRSVPGDGVIPLERLVPAIVAAGYTGWFDLEIIGPRLQAEGQKAGLARAGAYIGELIERETGTRD